jgi:hypothetical protein
MKRIVIMFAAMMISVSMANAQNQKTNRLDAQVNHMTKAMQLDEANSTRSLKLLIASFKVRCAIMHKKYLA